jgi:hypothetical protein
MNAIPAGEVERARQPDAILFIARVKLGVVLRLTYEAYEVISPSPAENSRQGTR